MPQNHLIYGCKGCGSTIAEALFELANIPFDRKEADYDKPGPERNELLSVNPLCQVPTVVLPNGEIMTESLALVHYVDSLAPNLRLIPRDKNFTKFLRWSTFMVTAIYPTFTYGDSPAKWVGPGEASDKLRASTDLHRMKLWKIVEENAEGPFFLGENFSAIDLYLSVMVHWRPRRPWFESNCPKIFLVAQKIASRPDLAKAFNLNFPH
ncbi:MAG: glutathione S-transferase family protein [Oligoflexales bacterium]